MWKRKEKFRKIIIIVKQGLAEKSETVSEKNRLNYIKNSNFLYFKKHK